MSIRAKFLSGNSFYRRQHILTVVITIKVQPSHVQASSTSAQQTPTSPPIGRQQAARFQDLQRGQSAPVSQSKNGGTSSNRQQSSSHDSPHHRKDSVSSNVSSNDGQTSPYHTRPPSPHHPNHSHAPHHYVPHGARHNAHHKQNSGMGMPMGGAMPVTGQGMGSQYRPPRDQKGPPGPIPPSPHLNPAPSSLPNTSPITMQPPQTMPMVMGPWPASSYPPRVCIQ